MNKYRTLLILSAALVTSAVFLFLTACEISNGDETVREVSIRVAGLYQNSSGIPANQSGGQITLLSISQSGDQLEAVDNLGARWTGTIGRAEGNTATFTLNGLTNTQVPVVITGNFSIEGTTSTLTGTWIEPSLRSAVFAEATVAAQPTATPVITPTTSVTPTPGPTTTPVLIITATPTSTFPPTP